MNGFLLLTGGLVTILGTYLLGYNAGRKETHKAGINEKPAPKPERRPMGQSQEVDDD